MPLFSQSAGPCVVTVNSDETIPDLVVSLQIGTTPFHTMSIDDFTLLRNVSNDALTWMAAQPPKPTKETPPAKAPAGG